MGLNLQLSAVFRSLLMQLSRLITLSVKYGFMLIHSFVHSLWITPQSKLSATQVSSAAMIEAASCSVF